MSRKSCLGFTLSEILIVTALIAVLVGVTAFTSIKGALQKARDSKRKQDLNKMARILEDYYNDHQRYPSSDFLSGNISGTSWGGPFFPYLSSLPKDPLSPSFQYFYYADNTYGKYYLIYAKLENTQDPDIARVGCTYGCAPPTQFEKNYNYVVHSPNLVMIGGVPSQYATGGGSDVFPTSGGSGGSGGSGSPTPTLIPTLTPVPGYCTHNECCLNRQCGADFPNGSHCTTDQRCLFDTVYLRWVCGADLSCPP